LERGGLLDLRDDRLNLLREIRSLSNVPLIVTTDVNENRSRDRAGTGG